MSIFGRPCLSGVLFVVYVWKIQVDIFVIMVYNVKYDIECSAENCGIKN